MMMATNIKRMAAMIDTRATPGSQPVQRLKSTGPGNQTGFQGPFLAFEIGWDGWGRGWGYHQPHCPAGAWGSLLSLPPFTI